MNAVMYWQPFSTAIIQDYYAIVFLVQSQKYYGFLLTVWRCRDIIVTNINRNLEVKHMQIRSFRLEDAEETAQVIAKTLRVSNSKDYTEEYIEFNINSHSADELIKASNERHMYVVCKGDRIIGTGGIAGYWGSLTESILLTIFVLPEYQKKGVGRKIIETLEKDEYFLRAKRIEIPASLTAVDFYRKMGYDYKNGNTEPEDGLMYRLEKFR